MASIKLQAAIAAGKVIVKNNIQGQVCLTAGTKSHVLDPGSTFNALALVTAPLDLLKSNLPKLLEKGQISLVA